MNTRILTVVAAAMLIFSGAACDGNDTPPAGAPSPGATVTPPTTPPPTTSTLVNTLKSLARTSLAAFEQHDVAALAAVAPVDVKAKVLAITPETPRYEVLFGADSWRRDAVANWEGALGDIRVDGDRARVAFAELEGGDVAYVDIAKRGDRWSFMHILRTAKADFDAWGAAAE